MVEDRGGRGLQALQEQTDRLIDAMQDAGLTSASTQFRSLTPQLFLDVDRDKAESLGLTFNDVNQTLSMYLGSLYVNSFNQFGRHWQVNIQLEGAYRNRPEDINLLQVRNKCGQMVPLGTLVGVREIGGPISVTRYNLYASASITGNLGTGTSSGETIKAINRLADETLPLSMKADWTEVMLLQIRAEEDNPPLVVFTLSAVAVFLALAALYESWLLPLAVILVVPMCLLSSVIGVLGTGRDVNIFVQIGLVVLVGLACKNAILIVEYAKEKHLEGWSRRRHRRGLPAAAAADPDDLAGLHHRRDPAGRRLGRRVGDAAIAGHRRVLGHGRRDRLRHLPHARVLLRHPGAQQRPHAPRDRGPLAGLGGGRRARRAGPGLLAGAGRHPRPIPGDRLLRAGGNPGHPGGARHPPSVPALGGRQTGGAAAGPCRIVLTPVRSRRTPWRPLAVISRFFIDRPVFAIVLSLVILLAGFVAWGMLPVAQYPQVTPPTVTVTAFYPGANAQTVRNTVAAPIEEQVSGVENMLYMSSQSTNDGTYNLTVTFRLGMDTDMAQVLVQNRVSLALPVIPALVQNEGISVKKMSPNTLMIVNLVSPGGRYDNTFLSNYATIQIKDELGRLPGVAGITFLGQRDYSLRAWLDPAKMAALNLSASDVINAISQQNLQVAAGQIGQQPVPRGQQFQLTINTLGRLIEPEQFEDIILKAGDDAFQATAAADQTGAVGGGASTNGGMAGGQSFQGGAEDQGGTNTQGTMLSQATGIVRLRDVARVEMGSRQYDQSCTLDGRPSVAISIYQLPGSNALETARGVYAKMRELKGRFPDQLDYRIVYDTTPFIQESIDEVYNTLRDAIILVGIVVLVFLQDWKAMILPMIDVPVSLIGTFAVMAALGFSLNNLTLFGLVLAIGIVVDDAIVVLENIERLIATGLDSRTATIRAMEEITGPILAITLVLSSVFIPCCFMGGISGQFFRQFAVTIAVSTIISAINALTMTPSRAVMIFKTEDTGGHGGHELKREALPWWFFAIIGGLIAARLGYAYASAQLGVTAEGLEDGSVSVWMSRAAWWAAFSPGRSSAGSSA